MVHLWESRLEAQRVVRKPCSCPGDRGPGVQGREHRGTGLVGCGA